MVGNEGNTDEEWTALGASHGSKSHLKINKGLFLSCSEFNYLQKGTSKKMDKEFLSFLTYLGLVVKSKYLDENALVCFIYFCLNWQNIHIFDRNRTCSWQSLRHFLGRNKVPLVTRQEAKSSLASNIISQRGFHFGSEKLGKLKCKQNGTLAKYSHWTTW